LRSRSTHHHQRHGSALVFALVVVTIVAGMSYSLLRITTFTTQRQASSTDDKRAFYVAEAGLAEAYYGLSRGYTGAIGTSDQPVLLGDGLAWVDATRTDDEILLRSTGLVGSGRATVEIALQSIDVELGIFADEGIELDVPFLIDGFDSGVEPYDTTARTGTIQADDNHSVVDEANQILFYEGLYYRYQNKSGDVYSYDAFFDPLAHPEYMEKYGIEPSPIYDSSILASDSDTTLQLGTGGTTWTTLTERERFKYGMYAAQEYFATLSLMEAPLLASDAAASPLGPSTGADGVIGSNGGISLSSPDTPAAVYGDILHGPEAGFESSGVTVSGTVGALPEEVQLDPVRVPGVVMLPGFVHDSALPRIIPSGQIGYESVSVAAGSELILVGPGAAVFGDLRLQPGSRLTILNGPGPVDLYVTGTVDFQAGALIETESDQAIDLSLQVVQSFLPVQLYAMSRFHGGIYAPGSQVAVGRDFEVFGYLVSRTLQLEEGVRLHFDTSTSGSLLLPRLLGWKIEEIPVQVRQNRGDPFRIFYTDDEQPLEAPAALETDCWEISVKIWTWNHSKNNWNRPDEMLGPAVNYQPDASEWVEIKSRNFSAPTTGGKTWHVRATWDDNANVMDYEGPFESFGGINGGHVLDWALWWQ